MRLLLEKNGFDVLADSKALPPGRMQRGRASQYAQYAVTAAWQALANAVRMRRELYFIARMRSA